jgi:hypothetical protein
MQSADITEVRILQSDLTVSAVCPDEVQPAWQLCNRTPTWIFVSGRVSSFTITVSRMIE